MARIVSGRELGIAASVWSVAPKGMTVQSASGKTRWHRFFAALRAQHPTPQQNQ
jgi:hypothetical protein